MPRPRLTEAQINGQLEVIAKKLSQGYTDGELIEELKISRSTYYNYKKKIFKLWGNVAQRKIEESIDFEASVLKDRLLRLLRSLEVRIQQQGERDSITDVSNGAQVASNLAVTIFKLEFEGMRARQGAAIKLEQQKANRYLEIVNEHQPELSSSSEESESEGEAPF